MTQSTEQERAEFEAWRIGELRKAIGRPVNLQSDDDLRRFFLRINKSGEYYGYPEQKRFEAWQAARRAQVVPQGWKLAIGLCELVECENAGDSDFERGMRTAAKRIRKELGASAPQPPEA